MNTRPHILLAEDDRLILFTFADGLSRVGYRVSTASDGEMAWQMIQGSMPDLLLLDIRMPVMDGLTLARRIRQISDVPIVFLTAYSDEDQVSESVLIGGYGYLVKPLEVNQIIPSVELALARCKELRALKKAEEQLQTMVSASRNISMALGVLKERYRLSESEAFEVIRVYSRSHRMKMEAVAASIVAGKLNIS